VRANAAIQFLAGIAVMAKHLKPTFAGIYMPPNGPQSTKTLPVATTPIGSIVINMVNRQKERVHLTATLTTRAQDIEYLCPKIKEGFLAPSVPLGFNARLVFLGFRFVVAAMPLLIASVALVAAITSGGVGYWKGR